MSVRVQLVRLGLRSLMKEPVETPQYGAKAGSITPYNRR